MQRPLPPQPISLTGPPALLDTLLSLSLWMYVVLLGSSLGLRLLRLLRLFQPSRSEALVWGLPTGLTLIGYPVYALGLLGLFDRKWMGALLAILALGLEKDMREAFKAWSSVAQSLLHSWLEAPVWEKAVWAWTTLLMGGSFLLALTPPTAYDALWYHLQAPRLFFEAGRIYPEWNNWPANYAFATSMLYALPMALGSDVTPGLLHWTFGMSFLGLLYLLVRPAAKSVAWIAPVSLLTTPSFFITLAPEALNDLAAASLELMVYGALLKALHTKERRWLWAAGMWSGLAASTKLSALPVLAVSVIFWLWRGTSTSKLRDAAIYVSLALLLMAPWYLKNTIWFGTPLFPTGIPRPDSETAFRASIFDKYMNNEYHNKPKIYNLYLIIASPLTIDFVIPPFPLAPLLFFTLISFTTWTALPVVLGGLRTIMWLVGPPKTRFLLAAFGLWSMAATTAVATQWHDARKWRRLSARAFTGVLLILFFIMILPMWEALTSYRPWGVALGIESRTTYLQRASDGYTGWKYVSTNLRPSERVLLIGDARHYYCPKRCYPEADQFTWPRLVWASNFDVGALAERLGTMGVTHLWLHDGSIQWLLTRDPQGWMRRSYEFLMFQFAPRCATEEYADNDVVLLRLTCVKPPS